MELSTFSNLSYSQFEGECHDCLVFGLILMLARNILENYHTS